MDGIGIKSKVWGEILSSNGLLRLNVIDFSKKIIENLSNKKIEDLKIKVITTDFHTLRSKVISRKSGYKQMSFYTSKSNSKLAILNYTREFFALISNIVLSY